MQKKTSWTKAGFFILTLMGVLAVAGTLYASGGGEGGSLSPEKLKDLLWRVLNFTGLVIILVWALKKPIGNGLSGRRKAIREEFEELEAQKAEAERKYKEFETKLAGLDAEVKSIIEAAVKQGEAEKQKIIDDATRAAEDIKRQAEMAIQHEVTEAQSRLRSEVADQAVAMAADIISANLQETDQTKLVEDYLQKVGGLQ